MSTCQALFSVALLVGTLYASLYGAPLGERGRLLEAHLFASLLSPTPAILTESCILLVEQVDSERISLMTI